MTNLIEQAKSRGELRADVPATRLAHSLFALFFFQLQRWLGGDPITARQRDEGLRAALKLQLEGLRNEPLKLLATKKSNPARRAASTVAARRNGRGGR